MREETHHEKPQTHGTAQLQELAREARDICAHALHAAGGWLDNMRALQMNQSEWNYADEQAGARRGTQREPQDGARFDRDPRCGWQAQRGRGQEGADALRGRDDDMAWQDDRYAGDANRNMDYRDEVPQYGGRMQGSRSWYGREYGAYRDAPYPDDGRQMGQHRAYRDDASRGRVGHYDEMAGYQGMQGLYSGMRGRLGASTAQNFGYQSRRGLGPRSYARTDERIREDVNERLMDDDHVDATEIEVAVKDATVTLSGSVRDRWQKHRAEDLADACSGVQDVRNQLRVEREGDGTRMKAESLGATGDNTRPSSSKAGY